MKYVLWKAKARILTEPQSLKEKRSVVKSALAKLRNKLPVSAAEVGSNDTYNIFEIGLSSVGTKSADLEQLVNKCRSLLEREYPLEFFEENVDIDHF